VELGIERYDHSVTYALLLLAQIGCLFLLCRALQRQLWLFWLRLTQSQASTMWLMALLFWPGTVIHEVSHLVMSWVLLVPAGHLTVWPKMADDRVIMGSVLVARTDRIRRLLIGLAPGVVGLSLILVGLWLAQEYGWWGNWVWRIILIYVVFEIANSLFSSKEDLEGALGLFLFLAIMVGILYWLGLRVSLAWVEPMLNQYQQLLAMMVRLLWLPLGFDGVGVGVVWGMNRLRFMHSYE
jgi:hypothetical protein